MDLLGRDEGQYWRPTVVPEFSMEFGDIAGVDAVYLLKVDERNVLSAKDAIELQKLERPPHNVRLRCFGFDGVQVSFASEERFGTVGVDAEIAPPIRSRAHNALLEANEAGSEDRRYDHPLSSLIALMQYPRSRKPAKQRETVGCEIESSSARVGVE